MMKCKYCGEENDYREMVYVRTAKFNIGRYFCDYKCMKKYKFD